jgi:hypothetical protein
MLWEWARAEISSPRFSSWYQNFPPHILTALRSDDRTTLNSVDRAIVDQIVSSARSPLLKGLLRLQTQWYESELQSSELKTLRTMNWPSLRDLAPSGNLYDLVESLEKNGYCPNDPTFAEQYRHLKENFDFATMAGDPILVATSLSGPYIVVEGNCRLSVLTLRAKEGRAFRIDAIIGICLRLAQWYHNDDPCSIPLL